MFTTIAWSLLNLLPVIPLDGGQAMRELLPGSAEVRTRRASIVSLVVLVPLFAYALYVGQAFLAVFLLVFGFDNVQAVRTRPDAAGGATLGDAGAPPEQVVVGLLWQGAPLRARAALESVPEGRPVDLAVHGAVMATTGEVGQGLALLAQERDRRPDDANVVALLVLTHILLHDWDAVVEDLRSDYAASVPPALVERAVQEATGSGREDVAARLAP